MKGVYSPVPQSSTDPISASSSSFSFSSFLSSFSPRLLIFLFCLSCLFAIRSIFSESSSESNDHQTLHIPVTPSLSFPHYPISIPSNLPPLETPGCKWQLSAYIPSQFEELWTNNIQQWQTSISSHLLESDMMNKCVELIERTWQLMNHDNSTKKSEIPQPHNADQY